MRSSWIWIRFRLAFSFIAKELGSTEHIN